MVSVRPATPEDAEAVAAIYEPVVRETSISFETEPPDVAEMRERIEGTLPSHPWLVCEDREIGASGASDSSDDDVVGYACAGSHRSRDAYRWSVDVSVYVRADARGEGVGSALYEALLGVLRSQGFVNAYAGVALPNPASVGFHESMGFEPVGTYEGVGYKDGEWRDVRWFHRTLRERERDPEPPVGVDALDDAALESALAVADARFGSA